MKKVNTGFGILFLFNLVGWILKDISLYLVSHLQQGGWKTRGYVGKRSNMMAKCHFNLSQEKVPFWYTTRLFKGRLDVCYLESHKVKCYVTKLH